MTYAKSQDGTYLFQDGEGNADEDRRKQQPMVPLLEAAAEHEHKGRGLVSNNTHSGVPCLTLCPRSWGAHDKICSSLVKQKVKISVLGLIDAMSVLPVANFISVLFTVQTNYSS